MNGMYQTSGASEQDFTGKPISFHSFSIAQTLIIKQQSVLRFSLSFDTQLCFKNVTKSCGNSLKPSCSSTVPPTTCVLLRRRPQQEVRNILAIFRRRTMTASHHTVCVCVYGDVVCLQLSSRVPRHKRSISTRAKYDNCAR